MNPIELTTDRLILRGITPALISHLFKSKTSEEIKNYFNVDDAGYEHLRSMNELGMETHRISLFYFLLIDKENDDVIGECGFHTWNRTHQRAELFYNLKKDHHKRRGYMSEALKPILEFGFTELNLHRIAGLAADWNIPSIKLLERNNFKKEGTMREDYVVDGNHEDSECYSLLKWEWEQYNRPA